VGRAETPFALRLATADDNRVMSQLLVAHAHFLPVWVAYKPEPSLLPREKSDILLDLFYEPLLLVYLSTCADIGDRLL